MIRAAAVLAAGLLAGCAVAPGAWRGDADPGFGDPALDTGASGSLGAPGGQPSRAAYDRLQAEMIAHGLMRTDYAPPDAPYTNADLVRDFGLVATWAEGPRRLKNRRAGERRVRRWQGPVRYRLHGAAIASGDRAEVAALMRRIARISGLAIAEAGPGEAENFSIWLTVPGEREAVARALAAAHPRAARAFDDWRLGDRSICVFNIGNRGGTLVRAHVFIGSEVTGLLRRSCLHEEIVQAMGLPNDDGRVRPSLFNDDEEFALFTEHDEWLMRLLYDPAIRPGMTLAEAEPALRAALARARPE